MQNQYILTPYFLDENLPGLENVAETGWLYNQPDLPKGNKQHRMGVLYQSLSKIVSQVLARGERPVSIAGDCCTSIGMLGGLQQAGINPVLVWFDAHGDFNTWETTPSGFLGGMPLAMLVGRGEQTLVKSVNLHPLPEAQVILTDARDLDPAERLAVESSALTHLTETLELLEYPLPNRPLYVHFDTDIITPHDAPAMNYLAPGGPTAEQLNEVFKHLSSSGQIITVSLSSWNPVKDSDGQTRQVCMHLLNTLIGGS